MRIALQYGTAGTVTRTQQPNNRVAVKYGPVGTTETPKATAPTSRVAINYGKAGSTTVTNQNSNTRVPVSYNASAVKSQSATAQAGTLLNTTS